MIPVEVQNDAGLERPQPNERLQTEYSFEDSQNSDPGVTPISTQITIWRDTAYAFLCSFFLLYASFTGHTPISILIIPFIACDAKRLYTYAMALRSVQMSTWAKSTLHYVVTVSCHLIFLLLLGAYLEWRKPPLLAVGAPQYLSLIGAMLFEHFRKGECPTFSKAVSIMQFRIFCLWIEAGTLVFVGLKVDGVLSITWSSVLWPCWAAESLLCLMTLGAALLLIYAACAYLARRCDGMTVACALWFFWVFLGISVSFALCLYNAMWFSEEMEVTNGMKASFAFPILFLVVGLAGLRLMETRITWWCYSFFIVEFDRPASSQDILTSISPLSSRRLNTRASPTHALLYRVSSTFFKPASANPEKKERPRTQVLPLTLSDTPSSEEKITSVSMLQLDSSPATPKKICMVCCQALSNAVVMNCGHSGICSDCASEIWKHTGICHMCREPIVKILEVEGVDDTPFVRVVSETMEDGAISS